MLLSSCIFLQPLDKVHVYVGVGKFFEKVGPNNYLGLVSQNNDIYFDVFKMENACMNFKPVSLLFSFTHYADL